MQSNRGRELIISDACEHVSVKFRLAGPAHFIIYCATTVHFFTFPIFALLSSLWFKNKALKYFIWKIIRYNSYFSMMTDTSMKNLQIHEENSMKIYTGKISLNTDTYVPYLFIVSDVTKFNRFANKNRLSSLLLF